MFDDWMSISLLYFYFYASFLPFLKFGHNDLVSLTVINLVDNIYRRCVQKWTILNADGFGHICNDAAVCAEDFCPLMDHVYLSQLCVRFR